MAWTKLEKSRAGGSSPRTTCAVAAYKNGQKQIILPGNIIPEGNYDILTAPGLIGLRPATNSGFSVRKAGKSSRAIYANLPVSFPVSFPIGTHEVPHRFEDGMLVLDISGVSSTQRAAE